MRSTIRSVASTSRYSAGRPSPRGRRPFLSPLIRCFQHLGPGVRAWTRGNPHRHPAKGARDLKTRTSGTAGARRQKDEFDVQYRTRPQGTRGEAREVFQRGRRVHHRSRRPIGVGVGRTHLGRRRDRGRCVLRRRWA